WRERGQTSGETRSRPATGGQQKLIDDSTGWSDGGQETKIEYPFVDVDIMDRTVSPDGRWLLTASGDDKTVSLWPLRVADIIDRACKLLPRNLTPDEWKDYQLEGRYQKTCPTLP